MSCLDKATTGLWIIDVQERLFPHIHRSKETLDKICFMIDAARILQLPIVVTEQNPKGLGKTVQEIQERLPAQQAFHTKSTFSGYGDEKVKKIVDGFQRCHWILVGIEAHICVLQTAKELLLAKMQPIVPSDCISARAFESAASALDELRMCQVRVTCAETVIYELIKDANTKEFKDVLPIIKAH